MEQAPWRRKRASQNKTEVKLASCRFMSQAHHFIDQEMLHLIGGGIEYPRVKNRQLSALFPSMGVQEQYDKMVKCQSEDFSDDPDPAEAKTGCPCTTPRFAMGPSHKYVEIGADNGKYLSNSFFLDKQLGWDGICVEPSPGQFQSLTQNRPNCRNVNAAVGEQGGDLAFIEFSNATWVRQMSGLKGSHPGVLDDLKTARAYAKAQGLRLTDVREVTVKKRTFAAIFEEEGFTSIDLLSVDVEGNEFDTLQSIDFDAVSIRYATPQISTFFG